jgi:hypothetical protein
MKVTYKIKDKISKRHVRPTLLSVKTEYINAYVELDKDIGEDAESLDNQTYHCGKVYGVDTAHSHNIGMSFVEKRKDALIQIRQLIKSYLKMK